MTNTTKKNDYKELQEELERRYGPAFAQQIIDQVIKTEKTSEMPDYMNFHAMSEVLESLRQESQGSLKNLKALNKNKQGRGVISFERSKAEEEFKSIFSLYLDAQQGFYRMYHGAMAAHIEQIPSWKKYQKTHKQTPMTSCLFIETTLTIKKAA